MTLFIFSCAFLLIGLNTPIFIALSCTAFLVFAIFTDMPLGILPQRMFAGIDNMSLIAIPYFIFAAQIMSKGGVTLRLIAFAQTLVGHLPGGLGICAIFSCLFFASISGSTASTVIAVGSIIYPALITAGYGQRFSLGLVTCSALLGMVIPPSNAMIIYGSISRVSIGALFMSGFGAGLVFVSIYSAWCVYHAHKTAIPKQKRASFLEILDTAKESGWSLGFSLVILGGIYTGVFTSTESAVVSVAYAIFVTVIIYRELRLPELWSIACETGLASAKILIMVAGATLFSWLLTVENITNQLVDPIKALELPWWAILLINNVVMLCAGMFIDVFSNILIFCPLMTPLIQDAGISSLHFGLIAAVNADIGNITPPFGLNLFIASGVFGVSYFTVVRAVLPWLLLALLCLMIISYIPQISLWLPSMIYPGSF